MEFCFCNRTPKKALGISECLLLSRKPFYPTPTTTKCPRISSTCFFLNSPILSKSRVAFPNPSSGKLSAKIKFQKNKCRQHTSNSFTFSIVIKRLAVWLESFCSQLLISFRQGCQGTISSVYLETESWQLGKSHGSSHAGTTEATCGAHTIHKSSTCTLQILYKYWYQILNFNISTHEGKDRRTDSKRQWKENR